MWIEWMLSFKFILTNKALHPNQLTEFATGQICTWQRSSVPLKIYSHFSLHFTEDESMTDRMRTACTPKLCTVTWKMLTLNQHCGLQMTIYYALQEASSRQGRRRQKHLTAQAYFMATCHILIIGWNKERDNRSLLERERGVRCD